MRVSRFSKRNYPNKQHGQSTVEYVIVVVFGILVLTTGPGRDAIEMVMDAMKDNYRGYSYAVSLSDYPDADDDDLFRAMLIDQGVPVEEVELLADDPQEFMDEISPFDFDSPPGIAEITDDLIPTSPDDFLVFF